MYGTTAIEATMAAVDTIIINLYRHGKRLVQCFVFSKIDMSVFLFSFQVRFSFGAGPLRNQPGTIAGLVFLGNYPFRGGVFALTRLMHGRGGLNRITASLRKQQAFFMMVLL
jgi:hypothetical protein